MKSGLNTVKIEADVAGFDAAMKTLNRTTAEFGRTFAATLARSVQSGKAFEEQLSAIGSKLSEIALKEGLRPLEKIAGSHWAGAPWGEPGAGFWTNGLHNRGAVASASLGSPRLPGITFNVAASDINSFKQSEAQITTLLARAVLRGQRLL